MKHGKKLLSILLALVMLCGLVQIPVAAVGTAAPTEMKLVGMMPITTDIRVGSVLHTNKDWGDKGLTVFFNQTVPASIGQTRCFFVVVDGDNQVVQYDGTNLIWSTARSTAELWQIRGNFIRFASDITIGETVVNSWTTLADALTTNSELANKGYKVQLRMMGVSGEISNNGYVDTVFNNDQKLEANLKVKDASTPIEGGTTDCYYMEIGTAVAASGDQNAYIKPTNIVTLDQAAMVDQTHLNLTFSQAVTVDTARNTAVLEIVSADGNSVANSYAVSLTAGNAVNVPAVITNTTWDQIQTDLAAATEGSYVRFKMTEKDINTAYGENQFNFVVDTVWGKDSFTPLRANTGAAAQYAHDFVLCRVDAPTEGSSLTLDRAQVQTVEGKDYIVLTFSHPVSWNTSSLGAWMSLNVVSATGGVISLGGATADRALVRDSLRYYGASGKQVILPLRNNGSETGFGGLGSIADIREWIDEQGGLGTNRLVVRIIDQTGDANKGNGYTDCFYRTDNPDVKLIRNRVNGSEEWSIVDLDVMPIDSISVTGVEVKNERNVIVSFDRAVTVQPNLYSAIRLVDENNTLYCADSNTGGATVYGTSRTDTTSKYLQWQVGTVTLNGTPASLYEPYGTTGQQVVGKLTIDYSKLVKIEQEAEAWFAAQGTPKDLSLKLCLEEKTVSDEYGKIGSSNMVVDSVYAADGSSCLPACSTNVNGHYAAITNVTFETLAQQLEHAANGDTVKLYADETVDELAIAEGVTLDLNGHTLTAGSVATVTSTSAIIDSKNGEGGIAVAKDSLLFVGTNARLPLYDNGVYRFFDCEMVHMQRAGQTADSVMFGVRMELNDRAYALLEDSVASGAELTLQLTSSAFDQPITYAFSADIVTEYAQNMQNNEGYWVIVLTVYGLDVLDEGTELTVTPLLHSSTSVTMTGEALTYTR